MEFLINQKYAMKLLIHHKNAPAGDTTAIRQATEIKERIHQAIKLVHKEDRQSMNMNEKSIVLLLSDTKEMCNGLKESFYQEVRTMPTGNCPNEWKSNDPYEIKQRDIKVQIDSDVKTFVQIHVQIAGKGRNKVLYVVINVAKMNLDYMMKKIEAVTSHDFFEHHLATTETEAVQKANDRAWYEYHNGPQTVVLLADLKTATKVYVFFKELVVKTFHPGHQNPDNLYWPGGRGVVSTLTTNVIHFTKPDSTTWYPSKVSHEYTTSQIFWVAINYEKPANDPNRPLVVYHLEGNCAVFGPTKRDGFCAALYPNNWQMSKCNSLNSFTPAYTKGKCGRP